MKNTIHTTHDTKKAILRDVLLAIAFLLIAILMFGALSTMAQTMETFKATRYGKEVVLTKDKLVSIIEFISVTEGNTVLLKWETKNIPEKGVYAVMRSEDGINYSYVSLHLAVKGENSFVVQHDSGNKRSYYRVLYISEQNTFCLSERKNTLDFAQETTIRQPKSHQ